MNKEKGSEGLSDFLRVTELKAPSGTGPLLCADRQSKKLQRKPPHFAISKTCEEIEFVKVD